jgi:hypothetical protein
MSPAALGACLGGPGLLEGLVPGAAKLHDLGAVDAALTGEGNQVGLGLAPTRQGRGPLVSAADGVHLVARADHAAVDDARHDRGELVDGHGDHRFVAQREPLLDTSLAQPRPPLAMQGQREQVGITEAVPDRRRLLGRGVGGPRFARSQALLDDRHQ